MSGVIQDPRLTKTDSQALPAISREEVRRELSKLMSSSDIVGTLEEARATGRLGRLVPGTDGLYQCDQGQKFHSEGDAFRHSTLVAEAGARIANYEARYLTFVTALAHDIGKPETRAVDENGEVTFYGHAKLGAQKIDNIPGSLGLEQNQLEIARWVAEEHMNGHNFPTMRPDLQLRLLRHQGLYVLMAVQEADALCSKREDGSCGEIHRAAFDAALLSMKEADALAVRAAEFKKVINGQDLVTLNVDTKSRAPLLKKLREKWDRGEISTREQALDYVRGWLDRSV